MPLFEGETVERSIICLQTIGKQLKEKLQVLRGFNEMLTLIMLKILKMMCWKWKISLIRFCNCVVKLKHSQEA